MRLPLTLLFAGALLASSPSKAADSGFYVGVGAGQATTEVDDILGTGISFDETATGYKVFGGYRFFPWFSVEGIYFDGGSPEIKRTLGEDSASLNVEVSSLVAATVFALPVGDKFEVFLKPGFAYWDSKTRFRYSSPDFTDGFSEDDSGTAFFIGAGAEWTNGNAGLRLEYEWFEVAPEYDFESDEFDDELDASASFLSLSIIYNF